MFMIEYMKKLHGLIMISPPTRLDYFFLGTPPPSPSFPKYVTIDFLVSIEKKIAPRTQRNIYSSIYIMYIYICVSIPARVSHVSVLQYISNFQCRSRLLKLLFNDVEHFEQKANSSQEHRIYRTLKKSIDLIFSQLMNSSASLNL